MSANVTERQLEAMNKLLKNGYKWAAKHENGFTYAYKEKPEKEKHGWRGSWMYSFMPEVLASLIPDWTVPLDIENKIKEVQK